MIDSTNRRQALVLRPNRCGTASIGVGDHVRDHAGQAHALPREEARHRRACLEAGRLHDDGVDGRAEPVPEPGDVAQRGQQDQGPPAGVVGRPDRADLGNQRVVPDGGGRVGIAVARRGGGSVRRPWSRTARPAKAGGAGASPPGPGARAAAACRTSISSTVPPRGNGPRGASKRHRRGRRRAGSRFFRRVRLRYAPVIRLSRTRRDGGSTPHDAGRRCCRALPVLPERRGARARSLPLRTDRTERRPARRGRHRSRDAAPVAAKAVASGRTVPTERVRPNGPMRIGPATGRYRTGRRPVPRTSASARPRRLPTTVAATKSHRSTAKPKTQPNSVG